MKADIDETEKALLRYALKLSAAPAAIRKEDIDELRRAGWGDRAIHDACQVVAYFAYVNRVADGLGVELESRWEAEGGGRRETGSGKKS